MFRYLAGLWKALYQTQCSDCKRWFRKTYPVGKRRVFGTSEVNDGGYAIEYVANLCLTCFQKEPTR